MLLKRMRNWLVVATVAFLLLQAVVCLAATPLTVGINQSRVLNFYGVERVAIANPSIADVMVVSGGEVLLVGKAPGVTTLQVWTVGAVTAYDVTVSAEDIATANEIKTVLGYADIRVGKVGQTIILEGTVNDQYQRQRAEKLAAAYGDKVVNLLEITRPIQIKIEAKIVEIDRDKVKNLGIDWGNDILSPGAFAFGQGASNSIAANALGKLGTYSEINGQLNALIKNGLAKILSQPNMITLSGDNANILVGGEIPVPISVQNGQIAIEWKEYGIRLDINPEVNAEGLINSRVKAEVSSLDWNSPHRITIAGSLSIPPLKMRKAEAAIALSSGQTMAIGGLIASEMTHDVHKLPLLGDLPIIGNLFKSSSFNRSETELIILITPTVVNPAEYLPAGTPELKSFLKENPWGEHK